MSCSLPASIVSVICLLNVPGTSQSSRNTRYIVENITHNYWRLKFYDFVLSQSYLELHSMKGH